MHMRAPQPTEQSMSTAEKLARLRLIRSENIGPITFHRLIERYGSAIRALDALPELAAMGGRRGPLKVCSLTAAEDEMAKLQSQQATAIFMGEPGYPLLLAHIDDAPPVLFVRGHAHLLCKRAIAVVGSRNASVNGRRFAMDIARALGAAGYLVVSGMARGIDAAAHQGALDAGTLAVMGGGVDVVYPHENSVLYSELAARGAICSEIACGTTPQARHFPRRNRIISGIARGIVVLEAGAKSGSLITARMALEQNREVFAVPGAPQDPRVRGANLLLREGAHLTESADDVLRVLADMHLPSLRESRSSQSPAAPAAPAGSKLVEKARSDVLNALDFGPTDIDDVIRATDHPAPVVAVVLLELEIAGRLERHPGNKVSLLAE